MTKKIGSSLASWKSAALLALVAMVAAVAFSGVLTNTNTASAAVFDKTTTDATAIADDGSVTAGATVYIRTTVEAGQTVSYEILSSSTATGSFTSLSATAGANHCCASRVPLAAMSLKQTPMAMLRMSTPPSRLP